MMQKNLSQLSNLSTSSLFPDLNETDPKQTDACLPPRSHFYLDERQEHEDFFPAEFGNGQGGCLPFELKTKTKAKPNSTKSQPKSHKPYQPTSFLVNTQIPLLPVSLINLRKQMLQQIYSEVNFFYELKHSPLRQEFQQFNQTKSPSSYFLILLCLFTFLFVPLSIIVLYTDFKASSDQYRTSRILISIISCSSGSSAVISGWLLYKYGGYYTRLFPRTWSKYSLEEELKEENDLEQQMNAEKSEENITIASSIQISSSLPMAQKESLFSPRPLTSHFYQYSFWKQLY